MSTAWIDFQKANDTVVQIWIRRCLEMYQIYCKAINFIMESMKNWRVKLATRGQILTPGKSPLFDTLNHS